MTGNDIIKALEEAVEQKKAVCSSYDSVLILTRETAEGIIEAYKSQKAEIDALEDEVVIKTNMYNDMKDQRDKEHQYCMHYITMISKASSEAIKEFAERLKEQSWYDSNRYEWFVSRYDIDNLVKEMEGGSNE